VFKVQKEISSIVMAAIHEFFETYEKDINLELDEDISLYGNEGVLDSLGLVTLIVMVEESIENELGLAVVLADEKAMSQKTSPFLTASSLINYIYQLVKKERSL
jgi:D-alanine--poly(phosphoribitol) ligase subunit 2